MLRENSHVEYYKKKRRIILSPFYNHFCFLFFAWMGIAWILPELLLNHVFISDRLLNAPPSLYAARACLCPHVCYLDSHPEHGLH